MCNSSLEHGWFVTFCNIKTSNRRVFRLHRCSIFGNVAAANVCFLFPRDPLPVVVRESALRQTRPSDARRPVITVLRARLRGTGGTVPTGRRRGWPHCAKSGLSCHRPDHRPRGVGTTGAGRRVLSDGPQTLARTHAPTDGQGEKKTHRTAAARRLPLCFIRTATVPAGAPSRPWLRRSSLFRLCFLPVLCVAAHHTTRSAFPSVSDARARNGERNDDVGLAHPKTAARSTWSLRVTVAHAPE